MTGAVVGSLTGAGVGKGTGTLVGLMTGAVVGSMTGAVVGSMTGARVGEVTGAVVGAMTGAVVGSMTGAREGEVTGARVGEMTGAVVGAMVGAVVGAMTGARVGAMPGARVGEVTGAGVGGTSTTTGPHSQTLMIGGRKAHWSTGICPSSPASWRKMHGTSGCPGKTKMASGWVTALPSPQTEHWALAAAMRRAERARERNIIVIEGWWKVIVIWKSADEQFVCLRIGLAPPTLV